MRILIVLSAALAMAVAKPGYLTGLHGLGYAGHLAYAAPIAASSQYHAQDALGQYSYGYAGGPSAKSEVKTLDGVTRGGYSYVDGDGKLQSVSYTADAVHGFRVSATNLPKAPEAPAAPAPAPQAAAPEPVQDTPEVAAAKSAHLAAVEEAKAAAAAAPEIPATYYSGPIAYSNLGSGFAYSSHAAAPAITSYSINAPLSHTVYSAASPAFSYSVNAPAYGYSGYPYYGYNLIAAPGTPADTPEVAAAKVAHAAAHIEAKARLFKHL